MNPKILIILILLSALFLRIVYINSDSSSLYGDELTMVYDSYSLLKTPGFDQTGAFLPLTFSMGAGRPAGYVYGSIPFVSVFGLSALGVRMLSILSGLGIIFLLYFLGKKLFDSKIGIAASLIAAFSPWDISLSRGGFEAHFALFLILLGIYLFLIAKEKGLFYIYSALCFGLTLHTYPTYKILLPLFLPLLFWFQTTKNILAGGKKYASAGIIIFIILGVLSLSQTFIGGSEDRFLGINIFSQKQLKETIQQKINFEREITILPDSISKIFHNKMTEYGKVLIENYLQNFSSDFLFIHGDKNPRHNPSTIGEFYLVDGLLILIGLLSFWGRYKKTILFLILWTILSPIPTAFLGSPHALRSSFMLPPMLILSALGLIKVLNMKNKLIKIIVIIIFTIQFAFFVQKLYFLSPNEYSSFWSYPAKLGSKIAVENETNFKYIIFSDQIDNIEYAYPFYAKIDPRLVIDQNKKRTNLGKYQFKKLDNIYIGYIPDGEIENFIMSLNGSVLFIGIESQKKFLHNFETVEGKDKSVALILSKKI